METIFNLFPICNNDIIQYIGYKTYQVNGSDEEKIEYLKDRVNKDFKDLKYVQVPSSFRISKGDEKDIVGINHMTFNTLSHNGTIGVLYESIFQICNANNDPLFVQTMIMDGKIRIDRTEKFDPVPKSKYTYSINEIVANDYFDEYLSDEGFQLDRLIDDDFFKAIKILFKNGFYISSLKLLLSAIDSIAYLEYGDSQGIFLKWIDKYCELEKINISSQELWEHRNSILHMTNSTSRKVKSKKVQELNIYVSNLDFDERTSDGSKKFFNLKTLIDIVSDGIEKWGISFNDDRTKFESFIDRYDLIISDKRYGKIYYD